MWRSLSGRAVPDLVDQVRTLLCEGATAVHIGTDSRHRRGVTDFVTVVVALRGNTGGRVFYRHESTDKGSALAVRLFREVELSLQVANALEAALEHRVVVHVDVNEDRRYRSARFARALLGMVAGHGFRVLVKPRAWCASHVADYVVNGRHRRSA